MPFLDQNTTPKILNRFLIRTRLSHLFLYLVFCLLVSFSAFSQTYPFARLTGNPMDTAGWFLAGDAQIGDTEGDADTDPDEMILCPPQNNRSGACFFKSPVNIATCQRWAAEFEYRMFDGTGADGIAFFFLNNPPRTYTLGGGIGIPPAPLGLLVVLDPWNNCTNVGSPCCSPKLQIRYGDGLNNYSECPNPPQPTLSNASFVRSTTYNRIRIEYDFGDIKVFINETLALSGFYRINFAGYFGLTSSTGGSNDRQSIKDFTLYTYKPILDAPNAGPDLTVCPRDTIQIGDINANAGNYSYLWYPPIGLSDTTGPAPFLTVNNPTYTTRVLRYYVSKDTVGGPDSRCSFTDEVLITVRPRSVALPDSFVACPTVANTINFAGVPGNNYQWSPTTFLTNPTSSNPTFRSVNNGDSVLRLVYQLRGIDTIGCVDSDSLTIVVPPNFAFAGSDKQICSGDTTVIGLPARPGANYAWFPGSQVIGSNRSEARFTGINNDSIPFRRNLIVTAFNPVYQCNNFDTIQVTLAPRLNFNLNQNQSVCSEAPVVLAQNRVSTNLVYSWSPDFGLNNASIANPVFSASNNFDVQVAFRYQVQVTDTAFGCTAFDSISVIVNPFPKVRAGNDTTVCSGSLVTVGRIFASVSGTVYEFIYPATQPGIDFVPVEVRQEVGRDTTVLYIIKASFNGCEVFDTMRVIYQAFPAQPQISGRRVLCENTNQIVYRASGSNLQLNWTFSNNGTLVSQNADSLVLNWNTTNSQSFVSVFANNPLGCGSTADTLWLRVVAPTQTPKPQLDAAQPDTFCFSAGEVYQVFGSAISPVQPYLWYVSPGANVVSGQGTGVLQFSPNAPGTIKIAVLGLFPAGTDTCVSWSDTLYIFVHPKPVKPSLSGQIEPCQNVFTTVDFNSLQTEIGWDYGSNADSLVRVSNTRLRLRWNQHGAAFVWLKAQSDEGCFSDADTLVLSIQPKPTVVLLQADSVVCTDQFGGKQYAFQPLPGSINSWTIVGGNIVSASSDSNQVSVNWNEGEVKSLVFNRVSDKGCVASPYEINVRTSATIGDINLVSFNPEDEKTFLVLPQTIAQTRPAPGRLWNLVNGDSAVLGTFDFASSAFTLTIDKPWETPPSFWATYQNQCGNTLRSSVHKPIILHGNIGASDDTINLDWSAYVGWPTSAQSHQVWHRNGALEEFKLLEILPGQTFSRSYFFGRQAFDHCFYVVATAADNDSRASFSNTFCFSFEHPLLVPNVVTLLSDGQNDRFYINNLELYAPAFLKVFNRHGKQIFETNNYKQDWPSPDIQSGTYFYELKPASGKMYRGWVEVIK